jgi:hypothetical protein
LFSLWPDARSVPTVRKSSTIGAPPAMVQGSPGTVALQTKYKRTKPALLSERTDLTPPATKTFVRKGISIMPFFRKTEISDADLDALAAHLARNTQLRAAKPGGAPLATRL